MKLFYWSRKEKTFCPVPSVPLIPFVTQLPGIIEHYILRFRRSWYTLRIPCVNFREKFLEFINRLTMHIILQETFLWSCPHMASCYIQLHKAFWEKRSRLQLYMGFFFLLAALLGSGEVGRIIVGILLNCTNMACFSCLWDVQGKTFWHTRAATFYSFVCDLHLDGSFQPPQIRSLRLCFNTWKVWVQSGVGVLYRHTHFPHASFCSCVF